MVRRSLLTVSVLEIKKSAHHESAQNSAPPPYYIYMNTRGTIITIIVLVIVIAIGWVIWAGPRTNDRNQILVPPTYVPPQQSSTTTPVSTTVQYKNTQYGFIVDLPQSWTGYTVVNSTWKGDPINGQANAIATSGPMISLRNPAWTSANPYQDIPIMIFTLDQWQRMQDEQFHIGAAPINPSELGRNSRYVCALPARYNFAYPAGVEEVQKILDGKPLKTFNP